MLAKIAGVLLMLFGAFVVLIGCHWASLGLSDLIDQTLNLSRTNGGDLFDGIRYLVGGIGSILIGAFTIHTPARKLICIK